MALGCTPVHIYIALLQDIRIDLSRVLSTVLTASLLLSFPAGTIMIYFPAFSFLSELLAHRILIQGSPDKRLHASSRSLRQLAAPFIDSRAKSSTAWLITHLENRIQDVCWTISSSWLNASRHLHRNSINPVLYRRPIVSF
jgi:hypothetical protein